MGITIKTNFNQVIKDFGDLRKHLVKNAQYGLDAALELALPELRNELLYIINEKIKIKDELTETNQDIPPQLNIPKSKNELIKYIFGEDISKSDYLKKSLGNKTVNDNSNVFVIKDGRIKIWKSVDDSSIYSAEEFAIKRRLINGIFVNQNNGKTYKFNPENIKGIKLECSRDSGQTIDSEKKFDAYKNSDKMSRTKDGSTYQRLAVWTVRQEDVKNMLNKGLPLDSFLDKIMEGDIETATHFLNAMNKNGDYNEPIRKLTNIRLRKDLTPNIAAYTDIVSLIKNLKINKIISNQNADARYILVSSYGESAQDNTKFFEEMRKQIFLWMVSNEELWLKAMTNAIVNALEKYDSKAKFV
jgi:hypothetical protein